ncbi:P-type ATPase, partial [Blyttiomyces sp. JEL0837]
QGVKESIASCQAAGIKVIMITGDHIATASAIARQLGILDHTSKSNNRTLKGIELDLLSEAALAELRPFPVVFARVSPDNKLKIVKALQSKNYSVAMTGDGVNDAPAIKKADVGVAMGIGGTEITKQAADIILSDDNFSTIVEAVREGRQVFDNIKKFIVYLLSCNWAEIFLFLIAAIINVELPFSTIQILWANIIADIPPAMSLGLEPAEKNIMSRPPRPTNQGVLTLATSLVVVIQGLIQSLATLTVYLLALNGYLGSMDREHEQRSVAFATLTTMQLVQSFLSRSVELSVFVTGLDDWLELDNIGANWYLVFVCVVIQIILVELVKLVLRVVERRSRSKSAQ